LAAALSALERAAEALSPVPPDVSALITTSFREAFTGTFDCWSGVRSGRLPMPAVVERWTDRLPELLELEARMMAVGGESAEVFHCDLRVDNVIIDASGGAWFCDWNWISRGPAWIDLGTLLMSAVPDHDVDALFREHPLGRQAPPDAPDMLMGALLGFFATSCERPPMPGSPYIRQHQRYYGELALDWLVRRRGWRR
jgi:hypothetical protein